MNKEISNRADFKENDSIEEMSNKHNENVEKTFERARAGERINLTDLFIDKEKIEEQKIKEEDEQ